MDNVELLDYYGDSCPQKPPRKTKKIAFQLGIWKIMKKEARQQKR